MVRLHHTTGFWRGNHTKGAADMETYCHKVQYYETDKMGITHHSNYIRWMEEARIVFLSRIGFSYAKLEDMGMVSPVLSVTCRYLQTTTFGDDIFISVAVSEFRGVKLHLSYTMKNADGLIVCEAASEHAFLKRDGLPVRMKKEFPELYAALTESVSTS